jgi:hypothetical protein
MGMEGVGVAIRLPGEPRNAIKEVAADEGESSCFLGRCNPAGVSAP